MIEPTPGQRPQPPGPLPRGNDSAAWLKPCSSGDCPPGSDRPPDNRMCSGRAAIALSTMIRVCDTNLFPGMRLRGAGEEGTVGGVRIAAQR
jgi:hypothetical protein